MLYDQRWDAKTKADPFSLESLIAWLEKQPKRQRYCYEDHGKCLWALHLRAHGHCSIEVYSNIVFYDGKKLPLSHALNDIAVKRPHTFGAALTRARAVLAERGAS